MNLCGSRVTVTGGSGFLGSYVVEMLNSIGAYVDAPSSSELDLRDQRETLSWFQKNEPEIVIHLAARVGGIGANQRHPGTFFYDNMAMGLNVLETSRWVGVKKVVIVGTVCSYPKFTQVPFRESDLWNGYPEETNAPYGIAKKSLLVMAQSYRKEFGCNFVMLFPANMYGPRDHFGLEDSHVIPAMIRKFVEAQISGEKNVVLWGDGSPTREFLYVSDAAEAILCASECYSGDGPVNIGTGAEISMKDLAEKISSMVGYDGEIVWDQSKPNGQPKRKLDTSRAKECFGFEATTPLGEGLKKTIEWYSFARKDILSSEAK